MVFQKMNRKLPPTATFLVGALALALCAGCGDSNSASVRGKVTYNGAAVTEGEIQLQPTTTGQAAVGPIQSDGSFVVGRQSSGDGAVVGKSRVLYTAPPPKYADPQSAKPGDLPETSKFNGLVPKTPEVEIKSGSNTLDIELVAPMK